MTRKEAINILKELIDIYITCHGEEDTVAVSLDNVDVEALYMAIQSLTAILELSQSLKAVNRYDMDEKVLIGFNMAVAIFNECFGEVGEKMEEE